VNNGLVQWKSRYANVEKAAEYQSSNDDKNSNQDFHRLLRQYMPHRGTASGYIEAMTETKPNHDASASFAEAVAIMRRLREPGGCPWDREQTFDSIRRYTLEETYEVLDAIERRDWNELKDELGDLLLQVLFYAQMASEAGHFTIREVIDGLNRKLVRRHPHVFGDEASAAAGNSAIGLEVKDIDSTQVLRNWEEIKQREKPTKMGPDSRLDEVSRSMPALAEASKLGSRAAKAGFDWPEISGLVLKLREETAELEEEIARGENARARAYQEMGDLLFTAVNLSRHLKIDPELALRDMNARFRSRFRSMEQESTRPLEQLPSDELEQLWTRAKMAEHDPNNTSAQ
jgi:MazG family protein